MYLSNEITLREVLKISYHFDKKMLVSYKTIRRFDHVKAIICKLSIIFLKNMQGSCHLPGMIAARRVRSKTRCCPCLTRHKSCKICDPVRGSQYFLKTFVEETINNLPLLLTLVTRPSTVYAMTKCVARRIGLVLKMVKTMWGFGWRGRPQLCFDMEVASDR